MPWGAGARRRRRTRVARRQRGTATIRTRAPVPAGSGREARVSRRSRVPAPRATMEPDPSRRHEARRTRGAMTSTGTPTFATRRLSKLRPREREIRMLADLRFALRTLLQPTDVLHRRRRPRSRLGIGAATSIFSVVDGVLFRPLAASPSPGSSSPSTRRTPSGGTSPSSRRSWDRITFSIPEYRDWRAQQTSFADVADLQPTVP